MKAIRYTLYAIAGVVVLLVLGVAVFAMTFDPNRYKGQIETIVKEKTGRTLSLKGNLELAFWPALGAKVNGVTLSERGSDQPFVALDSAHASVAVLPLLRGQAIVDGIRVSGLKATIVKEKDGRFNFSDLLEAKDQPAAQKPAEKKAAERQDTGGQAVAFDIGKVELDRSALTYIDKASGQELAVNDLKLSTGRIAQKAGGKLELKAAVKGKNPELDVKGVQEKQSLEAHIAAPELLIAADKAKGGAVTADLKMKEAAREIEAKLKLAGVEGSAKALVIPQLTADLAISDPSLPQKNVKIPVTGSLKADLEKQTVNADLSAKFDESNIEAKLGLAKFTPPSYVFDVAVDKLNLDRYSPPEQKPVQAPSEKGTEKPAPAPQKQAEDTPVDLSALKDLNANGRLQVGALQVKGLKLANLKAEVKAANGRLDVAPHSVNLYEGSATGAITAMADGRVAMKETLSGVAVGPLLRDFAQKDLLEGKGTVALDVNAAGKTVNTMKKSLAGTARVQLKDGAIKGINLAEVFRKAKNALGSQEARAEARQTQQTDFSEMTASFTIKNGVAHNDDLDVKAPLFRISGKGDIDIGNSTIDYVTNATVVASTQGQGGADLAQLAGLTVPVHLTGPFDAMKYQVNYAAAASQLAKSKVGERITDKLKERLGGGKPPAEGSTAQGSGSAPSGGSAVDKLKGLLGR